MSENVKEQDALQIMEQMADVDAIREIRSHLSVTNQGTVKGTMQNYMIVLREDPLLKGSLRFNLLNQRIDIVRKLWWNDGIISMTDAARDFFYLYFEQFYSLGNEKNMDKALRAEANSKQYHPICEYLNRLEWDGTERIRYVLKRYMGADDSDMVYECLKHFMMEALLRIFKPGCKADEMLCLVGTQGAGKSTFFRFLAIKDEWFSDDLRDLGDKKIYEKLRGHWIMEMSEMIAAISAKSNEEIKSFLSRQKDTFRNSYGKFEEDRPRQCLFAGTTNNEEESRAYFDQLWAEAMVIFNSCKDKSSLLKLPKEMEEQIIDYRKQFMQEDTMAGQVQGWLDGYAGTYVCSRQIWKEAFMRPMRYARSWTHRSLDGKEAVIIVSQKKDLVHSGAGSERERVKQRLSTNWTKMDS